MELKKNTEFKNFRQSLKLTQTELAAKLSVSQGTITDIERGRIGVSKKVVAKIKETFNILYNENEGENTEYLDSINTEKMKGGNEWGHEGGANKRQPSLKHIVDKLKKKQLFPDDYFDSEDNDLKYHFERKLMLDIVKEYKEINDIDGSLNTLQNFVYIIENLNLRYFSKVSYQFNSGNKYLKNGKFNYEKYRDDYFAEVRKLEPIKPALIKIAAAIKEFYKDIKDFDTEKVIEGYFFVPPTDISPSINETQASKEL